jgi:outer membrane protein assembly factor BamB
MTPTRPSAFAIRPTPEDPLMAKPMRVALLFLAAGWLAGSAPASNWDRFRGPNGTGTADDKDVPVTFGPKDNLLWKVPLPGTGNSSPVVWGQHLFVQAAGEDGKSRTLLCLDTADGKTRWQRTIPGVPAKIHPQSSFASSTPATDGRAVYVAFWDGKNIVLSAYDFQGTPRWSKDLGPFVSQHGAGASPILYKDKVIFANDMDRMEDKTKKPVPRPSILVALDKKDGRIVWETPREAERACYSAPFLLERPGAAPELVVLSTTAITAYDPDSGSKLWEVTGWQGKAARMPLRTVAGPALAGDVLVACSGDGAGDRLAVAFALPGKAGDAQRLWENPSRKEFPYVPCPLAHGEHFYFVNDAGYAGCYHARTGKAVWLERLQEDRFTASPLLIDGKVYAASERGDVFVFAAAPTYKLLAQNDLGERIRATPAVADNRLYVRGERSLFCIGKNGTAK